MYKVSQEDILIFSLAHSDVTVNQENINKMIKIGYGIKMKEQKKQFLIIK